jgi:hypothetical protein
MFQIQHGQYIIIFVYPKNALRPMRDFYADRRPLTLMATRWPVYENENKRDGSQRKSDTFNIAGGI